MLAAQFAIDAGTTTAIAFGGLMVTGAIYVIKSIVEQFRNKRENSITVLSLVIVIGILFICLGFAIPLILLQERDEARAVRRDLSEQGFDIVIVRADQDMAEVRTPDDGVMGYEYHSQDEDGPYYLDGTTGVVIEAGTSFQATARLTPEDLPGAEGGQS